MVLVLMLSFLLWCIGRDALPRRVADGLRTYMTWQTSVSSGASEGTDVLAVMRTSHAVAGRDLIVLTIGRKAGGGDFGADPGSATYSFDTAQLSRFDVEKATLRALQERVLVLVEFHVHLSCDRSPSAPSCSVRVLHASAEYPVTTVQCFVVGPLKFELQAGYPVPVWWWLRSAEFI